MNVTRKKVHPDLRRSYHFGKIMNWMYARKWRIHVLNGVKKLSRGKTIASLNCEERYIASRNGGPDIRVRIFRPPGAAGRLPAMLYNHGGGYVSGVPEVALETIDDYIKLRPCVIVAPDYRKAITAPYPAGFDDCYDTLLWMRDNARSLQIEPEKFIIAGSSAGGGLTAAIALKARDTQDVDIAFQLPLYPMLDHRQSTESATKNNAPYWDSQANAMSWELYLKNVTNTVPVYASPALNRDYSNLPPTITFIGELDPFRDEVIAYVNNLKSAQIPVQFKVFERAFHGFENCLPRRELAKRARTFHHNAFVHYFDTYITNRNVLPSRDIESIPTNRVNE